MLTNQELLYNVLLPVIISALIAGIGAWRRWPFTMPLAIGAAFIVAYATSGLPKFPPHDGTDWLFWLAIPLTLIAIAESVAGKKLVGAHPSGTSRFGWILGAAAGAVAALLLKPLGDVSSQVLWTTTALFTLTGVALVFVASLAQRRLGSFWTLAPFCVAAAGAGVVILSSDSRTIGLHGIAVAAAIGPVVVLGARLRAAQSVAIVIVPLLAGLLLAGHFYAGVTRTHMIVLLAAPLLLLLGVFLPIRQQWLRGLIALLATIIAVAAVTAPTALAAKSDPYADMYK
ncbi:MAG: hypothetical protein JWN40_5564 [Phycisphaerales bacterium]|nr:hypothetical protein [Phycisphaerales bacterium]